MKIPQTFQQQLFGEWFGIIYHTCIPEMKCAKNSAPRSHYNSTVPFELGWGLEIS